MISNILVAVDGSDHAERAIELAADIAAKYGATLHLINVIESAELPNQLRRFAESEHLSGGESQIYETIARQILDEAAERARNHGAEKITPVIGRGDVAEQILSYAKDNGIDFLVVGSRGLSGFKSMLLGSVSHKVSTLAPCTCVTVR